MNGFDLDNPLASDDCIVCGAEQWWRCLCDTDAVDVEAVFSSRPGEGGEDS